VSPSLQCCCSPPPGQSPCIGMETRGRGFLPRRRSCATRLRLGSSRILTRLLTRRSSVSCGWYYAPPPEASRRTLERFVTGSDLRMGDEPSQPRRGARRKHLVDDVETSRDQRLVGHPAAPPRRRQSLERTDHGHLRGSLRLAARVSRGLRSGDIAERWPMRMPGRDQGLPRASTVTVVTSAATDRASSGFEVTRASAWSVVNATYSAS